MLSGANVFTGALMLNSLTWCDLPDDVSQWPGLPLSLSGDEVMPLDYHAGRSGWLLYGRNLDKTRLTTYQRKLGAAMVIVAAWCVDDYQVIRLAGSLTPRASRLAHDEGMDVAPLGKIPHLRSPGLLVMDMDSTAIQIECIDEIAKLAGTGEMVAEVTERAMRGELDFTASLRSRVATLKGADANILMQVRESLPLMPGLVQLVLKLETLGWKVAIASGGFTFFADYLRDKLHLTAAVANELEIMDGKFTGQVLGDIVDAQYKANTLKALAEKYEIPATQTVAIGDGANDLPMIKAAGLGIAFHAKPKVNEKAEVTIRHADLMGVFCILSGSINKK
jgi:phosphoserine phosphatase